MEILARAYLLLLWNWSGMDVGSAWKKINNKKGKKLHCAPSGNRTRVARMGILHDTITPTAPAWQQEDESWHNHACMEEGELPFFSLLLPPHCFPIIWTTYLRTTYTHVLKNLWTLYARRSSLFNVVATTDPFSIKNRKVLFENNLTALKRQ